MQVEIPKLSPADDFYLQFDASSRVQQLQKIQDYARTYFSHAVIPITKTQGYILSKYFVIEYLACQLNNIMKVSFDKIEIDKEKLRQLDDLLYTIHIYSAAFMAKKYEEIDIQSVQETAKQLFEKKNADYGDAFAQHGCIGVLVRMCDKMARFLSIRNKAQVQVSTETELDTLLDLNNYSTMALMLLH